jgi:pyruvate dehydrogenase E1 component alpha subunit
MTNKSNEKYPKEFMLDLLKKMILIRRFEELAAQMYGLQKIGGFCHLLHRSGSYGSGSC